MQCLDRFAKGDGTLKTKTKHQPLDLDKLEQMKIEETKMEESMKQPIEDQVELVAFKEKEGFLDCKCQMF